MHGKNTTENQSNQKNYYDSYVKRQKKVGINKRHEQILDRLLATGVKSTDEILEIGCGIGTLSYLLSKKLVTGGTVDSCDISPKSIKYAVEMYRQSSNLNFFIKDIIVDDLPDKKYDTIVLPDVIEHIPIDKHKLLFQRIRLLLKENGKVFINIPNPPYLDWVHENKPDLLQIIDQPIYTNLLLSNIADTDFYLWSLQTYSIWVKDGDYQFICLRLKSSFDFSKKKYRKYSFFEKVKMKLGIKV